MSLINADVWIIAEARKQWHCSQVQVFLYNRSPYDPLGRTGTIVVRDCTVRTGSQVIFSQDCTAETYDWVSMEAKQLVRKYCLKIVEREYLRLIEDENAL